MEKMATINVSIYLFVSFFLVFSICKHSNTLPCVYTPPPPSGLTMGQQIFTHVWKNVRKSSKLWTFIGFHCADPAIGAGYGSLNFKIVHVEHIMH